MVLTFTTSLCLLQVPPGQRDLPLGPPRVVGKTRYRTPTIRFTVSKHSRTLDCPCQCDFILLIDLLFRLHSSVQLPPVVTTRHIYISALAVSLFLSSLFPLNLPPWGPLLSVPLYPVVFTSRTGMDNPFFCLVGQKRFSCEPHTLKVAKLMNINIILAKHFLYKE